jgi:hypothetical protein
MSKIKRPNTKFQQLDGSYRYMGTNAFKDNYMYDKLKGSSKLLTEQQKEDGTEIKKKFRYYKMLGFSQTKSKADKISKLENLANGVIDPKDFLNSEEIRDLQTLDPRVKFEEDDIELEYFPIVPNLINRLEGGIDKHYMGMTANAVSNGTVNEILEERNNWLKSKMSELMQKALEGQVQDPKQVQAEIQERLKYYSVDYRHEIEKWANVVMQIENEKYNLQNLSRKGFRTILSCQFSRQ